MLQSGITNSDQKEGVFLNTTETMDKKHKEDMQRLRGMRLFDDVFFTKCFDNEPECVELVLQIVLEKSDLKVVDVRTQVFEGHLLNRSVRLDVLATDSDGKKFNIEIQRDNKGADEKRARYNSSLLDVNILEKGKHFTDLPETYVIFITEHDVLGMGEGVYLIERCFVKSGKRFEDGSHIVYVNGAIQDDSPVGKLMHDFSCTEPADMCYNMLADRVRYFKETEEGISVMCKVMEDMRLQSYKEGKADGIAEGKAEGKAEGQYKAQKDTAFRMLSVGTYSLEEISSISGLPLGEIQSMNEN